MKPVSKFSVILIALAIIVGVAIVIFTFMYATRSSSTAYLPQFWYTLFS